MIRTVIAGIGSHVPPRIVRNDDLAKLMTTSDEWIRTRSGIQERRFADEGVYCSDLALEATQNALADARLEPSDLDFIIFATISPDHHFPGTGCFLQAKLGVPSIGCLDVRNQCTGFLYGLAVGDAFIRTGMYRNILVVGSEVHSSALNFSDAGRDVTVLFGDGAGAVVLAPSAMTGAGSFTRSSTPMAGSPRSFRRTFGIFPANPISPMRASIPGRYGPKWTGKPSSSML